MKATLCSAFCVTLIGAGALAAQPSFTKITEGPLATDLGVMPICPAWGDLNNNGYLDLVMVDLGPWAATNDFTRTVQMVYLNNADGTFRRATEADIGPLATRAVVINGPMSLADYDNDGYLDFFNMAYPGNRRCMMRNNRDGTFTEVNLGALTDGPAGWLAGCADYDNDGFIDVMVPSGASNTRNGL